MDSTFDHTPSPFSGFEQEDDKRINFEAARRLKVGGTTCDTYVTRINGRLIFVKKLKEEFRNKPIYLSAFQKEFEVGAMLRHNSLPVYLEHHDDYLCLDYIDGQTLSDMIANYDPWLVNKENIKKLLRELLDVLAYLHDKNIVHCDIKADNIMLTYGSHNLFLIDLDKCYTSWYDNTAGSSEKYGMRESNKKSFTMDFKGIGRLLETMESNLPGFPSGYFYHFINECFTDEVTIESLQDVLKEIERVENLRSQLSKGRKRRNRTQDLNELSPKELVRLELDRKYFNDTLTVFDGPLQYRLSKKSHTASVCCREQGRELWVDIKFTNPYEVNGEKYTITEIPLMGFAECYNLKSIILPEGITGIYRATFIDCVRLEYVKIPTTVKKIGKGIFSACPNIKKIEFENLEGISISDNFIQGSKEGIEIIDLSTGISYSYEDFIEKFGKKD